MTTRLNLGRSKEVAAPAPSKAEMMSSGRGAGMPEPRGLVPACDSTLKSRRLARKISNMHPLEVVEHVRRQPFQPFRIHMSDGAQYDVPHPEFIAVTVRHIYVAVEPKRNGLPTRGIFCDPLHVTRIEPLDGNGRQKRGSGKSDHP